MMLDRVEYGRYQTARSEGPIDVDGSVAKITLDESRYVLTSWTGGGRIDMTNFVTLEDVADFTPDLDEVNSVIESEIVNIELSPETVGFAQDPELAGSVVWVDPGKIGSGHIEWVLVSGDGYEPINGVTAISDSDFVWTGPTTFTWSIKAGFTVPGPGEYTLALFVDARELGIFDFRFIWPKPPRPRE